jgi:hypothetical protein
VIVVVALAVASEVDAPSSEHPATTTATARMVDRARTTAVGL